MLSILHYKLNVWRFFGDFLDTKLLDTRFFVVQNLRFWREPVCIRQRAPIYPSANTSIGIQSQP